MKTTVEVSQWIFKCGIENKAICDNCKYIVNISNVTPHCPICGAKMLNYQDAPCECYHIENGEIVCWGTKEKDHCSCGGDKRLCDFYEYGKKENKDAN